MSVGEGAVPGAWGLDRRRLLAGLFVGLGAWTLWWTFVSTPLAWSDLRAEPGLLALGGACGVVALQVVRTRALLPEVPAAPVRHVVLLTHGLNTAFSVAGDVVELAWLTRGTGLATADVVGRVLYRAVGTALAALAAVGVGVGGVWAGVGLAAFGLYVGVGLLGGAGRLLPGPVAVLAHAVALVAQTALAGFVVWASARAAGGAVDATTALAGSGVVDLLSYVPLPGATLGLHQAGFTWSTQEAGGATVHHLVAVLVGVGALGLGALGLRGAAEPA